jgi:hypothetical protein
VYSWFTLNEWAEEPNVSGATIGVAGAGNFVDGLGSAGGGVIEDAQLEELHLKV